MGYGESLGPLELQVLLYMCDNKDSMSKEVVSTFAKKSGISRSTTLTLIDRLLKKKYLDRYMGKDGVFRYEPRVKKEELLNGLVHSFVEKTLGGSVKPLLFYLSKTVVDTDVDVDVDVDADLDVDVGGEQLHEFISGMGVAKHLASLERRSPVE